MHVFTVLTTFLLLVPLCLTQNTPKKIYQGFNSGATLSNRAAKKESDFLLEFKAAQLLSQSPGIFSSVRLYTNVQASTKNTPIEAFSAAVKTNTTILLGVWTSGTESIKGELEALQSAVKTLGTGFTSLVAGISVGSEDLYRTSESGIRNKAGLGKTPDQIVTFIKEVRESLKGTALDGIPVGHVDTWSAWTNTSNSKVVDAVDFLGTDLYPYYENDKENGIENAKKIFDNTLKNTTRSAKGKEVWITETGWPVSGPSFGQAQPSTTNAKTYWDQVGCSLFGKTNTWWYNLRDSNPDNQAKFALSSELKSTPAFDLKCPAGSGAPISVNTGAVVDATLEDKKGDASAVVATFTWFVGIAGAILTQLM